MNWALIIGQLIQAAPAVEDLIRNHLRASGLDGPLLDAALDECRALAAKFADPDQYFNGMAPDRTAPTSASPAAPQAAATSIHRLVDDTPPDSSATK